MVLVPEFKCKATNSSILEYYLHFPLIESEACKYGVTNYEDVKID